MVEKWYRSLSMLAFYNIFTGTGGRDLSNPFYNIFTGTGERDLSNPFYNIFTGTGERDYPIPFIIIYNNFTRKLREVYFTKSSQNQFCLQNIKSAARDIF